MSDKGAGQPRTIFSLTNHELYVVTARDGDRSNGQIATWVLPATLVPDHPRVLAIISPNNYTHELIAGSRRFVLNMLSEDQYDLVPLFGLYSGRDRNKFKDMNLQHTESGIPVLPDTCGWAECHIIGELNGGDRMIYLADMIGSYLNPDRRPLRKNDAFARLSPQICELLEAKQRQDGLRDAAFISPPDPATHHLEKN